MTPDAEALRRLGPRLWGRRPGLAAQLRLAPHPPPGTKTYVEAQGSCLKAGVMILVYPRRDEWHLVLIRRTQTGLHHADQIGLPGGQMEEGESPEQAAIREVGEELGVLPDSPHILGPLTPLYIPPSNYCVYPVVALSETALSFSPDPREVAETIEVPLGHFFDPATLRRETRTIRGQSVDVPYYAFGPHKIWGATAMVLAEFLEILKNT